MVKLPARASDPDTSKRGMKRASTLAKQYDNIASIYVEFGGMCDAILVPIYGIRFGKSTPSGIRTRRKEMVAAGRVVDTGREDRSIPTSTKGHTIWDLA